jgi:hypothetical protein
VLVEQSGHLTGDLIGMKFGGRRSRHEHDVEPVRFGQGFQSPVCFAKYSLRPVAVACAADSLAGDEARLALEVLPKEQIRLERLARKRPALPDNRFVLIFLRDPVASS